MIYRHRIPRFICAYIAIAATALLLSGCGNGQTQELGFDGYAYQAQELFLLNNSEEYLGNIQVSGEYLYYYVSTADKYTLFRAYMDREDGMRLGEPEHLLDIQKNALLLSFAVDEEQNIYCCFQKLVFKSVFESENDGCRLVKYGADLREEYRLDLPDNPQYTSSGIMVNSRHEVCLLTDQSICLVDAQGNLSERISVEEYKEELGTPYLTGVPNGYVYYVWVSINKRKTFRITGREQPALERVSELGEEGYLLGTSYGLLYCDEDILYRYDPESASYRPILRWSDSNLPNPNPMPTVLELSEDELLVFYSTGALWESQPRLYYLEKKALTDLPQQEQLVLATRYGISTDLEKSILAFNQLSSRYHITVITYDTSEEEARLDASLLSSNPPDLMNLSRMNVVKYAEKQVLEDLTPYLDGSVRLNKDSYLPQLLEAYTIGGRLVCVPSRFNIRTMVGRASQIESCTGWTIEDAMRLAEQYLDSVPIKGAGMEYLILQFCSYYIPKRFVDQEKGECRFDTEEFRSLIRWLEGFSSTEGFSFTEGLIPEDSLITDITLINPSDFALAELQAGEPLAVIGYPTADGRILHRATAANAIGIVSGSRHKEGAWAFLEYFLERQEEEATLSQSRLSTDGGFPIQQDILTQQLEAEKEPVYRLDANGDPILDQMVHKQVMVANGQYLYYYHSTEEQIHTLLQIIEHADFTPMGYDTAITDILLEELGDYPNGGRTLEEITPIIQNRVMLLLQERS